MNIELNKRYKCRTDGFGEVYEFEFTPLEFLGKGAFAGGYHGYEHVGDEPVPEDKNERLNAIVLADEFVKEVS